MTMKKSAANPFDVNHLWPLMTHSSPSRLALVFSERGSEPAFSGSVIEKPDSICPSMSGSSHFSFCSLVPYLTRIVWLPEFGATTPNSDAGAEAVGEDLVHVGVGEEVEAHAAVLLGQVRRPQAVLLDPRLDVLAQLLGLLALGLVGAARPAAPQLALVRQDLLVDDRRRAHADVVDPLVERRHGLDVHRHGRGR